MFIVIAVLVILAIITGIHLYLWKRLVRDTLTGRARRLGGIGVIVLALSIPLALIGGAAGAAGGSGRCSPGRGTCGSR